MGKVAERMPALKNAAPAEADAGVHATAASNVASAGASEGLPAASTAGWSTIWQVPTILASVGLIVGGVYYASRHRPQHDFAGAYEQVQSLIETHQYDPAADLLESNIAPRLAHATDEEEGRFYALAGDVLSLKMDYEGVTNLDLTREVTKRYERAASLHYELDPSRVERWADAALKVGDVESARARLATLEVQSIDDEFGTEAAAARNRVLRQIVDHSIINETLPLDDAMAILTEYRTNESVSVADEAWAIARQAALRIESGRIREAIDWLQIDMRRLEPRVGGAPPEQHNDFGELYTLLGRGYYLAGEFPYAREHIERGLDLLDPRDPRTADSLLVLGRILLAQSRFDEAFDAFSRVVSDYTGTRAFLPGLLGRAELHGVLGRHVESRSDFVELSEALPAAPSRRDVSPRMAIEALIDRHDAALAANQVSLALEYILLAEKFMPAASLGGDALIRLAATHRAEAEQVLSDAGIRERDPAAYRTIDVGARRRASEYLKRAGDFFVLHANAVQSSPVQDEAWMDSVLNAADAFDRAGYYDLAIGQFRVYVEGRSSDDPARLEALFRMAQCHRAVFDYARATTIYEEILNEHPKSAVAARCHVPLAACYEAIEQPAAAEQQLLRVVQGKETVQPEATDYRDALLALGTLYYNNRDSARAIEELTKAVEYYADAPEINDIRFRLADAYRQSAQAIAAILAEETLPRSIVNEKEALRARHLVEAEGLFEQVIEGYDRVAVEADDGAGPNVLQNDYLRLSFLYRAHCAFDLGNFDQAIQLYDLAARRYAEHPMSLLALIQIVNAYMEMGDRDRALTAHNRAILRLNQLPDAAFDSDDSVMDEQAWKRWLEGLPPGVATNG